MRRVTLKPDGKSIVSEHEHNERGGTEKGVNGQNFAVSNHAPYILLEVLERSQLVLPRFDANGVSTEVRSSAPAKLPATPMTARATGAGEAGGICSKRAEGLLGIVCPRGQVVVCGIPSHLRGGCLEASSRLGDVP